MEQQYPRQEWKTCENGSINVLWPHYKEFTGHESLKSTLRFSLNLVGEVMFQSCHHCDMLQVETRKQMLLVSIADIHLNFAKGRVAGLIKLVALENVEVYFFTSKILSII